MPTLETLALGKVLAILQPSYGSLDVRLVLGRVGGDWVVAAGVVAATNGTSAAVRRQQAQLKRSRPSVSSKLPFQLILEALEVSELSSVLNGLQHGALRIRDLDIKIQTDVHDAEVKIRKTILLNGHRALAEPEQWRFPRYSRSIRGAMSAEDVLQRSGVVPADLHLPNWNHLNAWFGFDLFDPNGKSPVNLELSFPIYAALDERPVLRGAEAVITGRAHGSLQSSLVVHWAIGRDSTVLETSEKKLTRPPLRDRINAFSVIASLDPTQFGMRHHISFQLFHGKLGAVGREISQSHGFLHGRPDLPPDPLRILIELFDGGKHLAAYLRNQRPERKPTTVGPFESGVLWLLSLLDIRSFPLLLVREAENVRSGKEWRGSADIAAHHPTLGLILLDCTRTVPDALKADHLYETARYIRTQLGVPLRAAIVTAADILASRPERAEQGVAVIDGADLEELHSLTVNGNVEAARNHLGMLLDHATRRDAV